MTSTIPAKLLSKMKQIERTSDTLLHSGVTIFSPRGKRPYWRVKFYFAGRAYEKSGGTTYALAYEVIQVMVERLLKMKFTHAGLPEFSYATVAQMVDDYIANGGTDGDWSERTRLDRASDSKALHKMGSNVKCHAMTEHHLRSFVNTASTHKRGATFKNITGTLLRWGWASGYLIRDQAEFMNSVRWKTPTGYKFIPTRRDQAKVHSPLASGAPGGNVPSHGQVSQLAKLCGDRYIYGEGLIHTAANLGLRSAELRILTADKKIALQGQGNLINTASAEVHVRFQASQKPGKLPKGSKLRDVVIPPLSKIATGFDVRCFLNQRCQDALQEQADGTNDLALIFPTTDGNVWRDDSLRKIVWSPAAVALGWKMTSYQRADGKSVSMLRFTLHSMRDRFATTAVGEWRYREDQLLEQGSWADSETVRRFYAGITDDTHDNVRRLHGLGGVA